MSKRYRHVFFDLDGTLTDSEDGIIRSIVYALERMGVANYDAALLKQALGPPLLHSFTVLFGMSREDGEQAIKIYRERFERVGMLSENRLYPGILDMLKVLRGAGRELSVVTSKPEPYALRIVEHFGLAPFFEGVHGSSLTKSKTEKIEVLHSAMAARRAKPEDIVMAGDRKYDLEAAMEAGVDGIGVLYGYGSREELERYDHVLLAESVAELTNFLK